MARIDQVFALTPDDVAHLDGLELIGLGTNHSHTMEHVLEIFGPLARVEVYTNQQPVALFDTLAARHAATMTRVGLGHLPSYRGASLDNEDVDQVCGRMREHFDDQRGLEGLTLHDTVGSQPGAHAWLPDLLAHPATHALDTLSIGVRADVFDPNTDAFAKAARGTDGNLRVTFYP